MDSKFNNETTEGGAQAQPQEKGRQTGMVVLLLLLLGGFGYLYFFTGLIRPQEQPPAPQPPPQVVKQPLPARDAAPVDAAKPAEQKAQVTPPPAAPAAPVAAAVKPVQKPADAKVAAVPTAKPEEKKPAPVKPAVKPGPVKAAAAPAVKKPELAKPAAPAKQPEKGVAEAKPAQAKQVEPVRKAVAAPKKNGPWTVVAGLYVVEEVLAEDLSKVKKAGFTPLMTSGPKRPVAMNRLFYAEYTNKEEAQQAVEKLQRAAGSGFSTQRGTKHEVYAGSYAVQSGAQAEQQRLSAAGIKVSIKKAQVPLASRKLTAGTFTDRKAADDAVKKLKAAGIAAPVLE
ncbi:Sporulation related domain-containing protein [Trichlorobacter thiogenes]|uniref:Sporulation related domain-containing protein n=1 Tax=Trichlorobacter thiogenes TaxID=115783 RepID=A0A1T4RDJ0_9BACT|nr:SPOR domain-containing protein [Trichlorobacter thiogenes]SKA14094.1 Sporulation related domain-containing protein [Trichlorobacter thiogenes]